MPKYDVISFLSDMGTVDESVGVCKAIIFQQAPHVNIFDITHDVPQFDVRAGALALTRAIQFLPNGIVIAAVDPGSPREQRYIAVEMEEGVLIGPDNGILAPAAQLIGEPKRVVQISNPDFRIEAPGDVFAARDILAPAAGVLAAGTELGELGPVIPLDQLVPGMLQLSRHDEGGAFLGEVWSLDRFGNVQLNITPEELASKNVKVGDTVSIRVGENDFMAKYVERYADLAISQVGILVDSTGMISIVKNLDYAARELDVKEGKAIAILPQGATITGRDITVEVFSGETGDNVAGGGPGVAPQVIQGIPPLDSNPMAQNPAIPSDQIQQQSQPLPSPIPMPITSMDSYGTMPPNPVDQVAVPTNQEPAPPLTNPNHQFVEREFVSDPGLPPDPFASAPVAPAQDSFATPPAEMPRDPFATGPVLQPNDSAPQDSPLDYRPAPAPSVPQAQQPDYVPAPGMPDTPSAPPSGQVSTGNQGVFGQPPTPPPVSNPQVLPEAPASYFPPPVVEQPPVPAPDAAPIYNQNPDTQPPSVEAEQISGAGLPQNVFDLFKGPEGDSSEETNSSSDQ